MPIAPVHGHATLRDRLLDCVAREALPASLLLVGPRGVGKQRLALWLGQALLCQGKGPARPCGECQSCRYALELAHPDLHWFFPRPRLKDTDPSADDVVADYADAIQERVKRRGLYAPSAGNEGIYVATVRTLVQRAAISPALGRRKVFVVGDAERMVPQTGADQAANAFLKLLEEPLADTTIVLTSSEPGALLPTIRSRVVTVRVAPLTDGEVRGFLADPAVTEGLRELGAPAGSPDDRVRAAAGAPGTLVGGAERSAAEADARRLLDAALVGSRADRLRVSFTRGAAGARGAYSDVLDALTVLLRDVAREAARPGADDGAPRDLHRALAASRAVDAVERAKERAAGNASPQLVTEGLLRELAGTFR
jgi:DNA polymerase III subunit delta'